ncbi:MAG: DUF2232 domain-containing protein [Deferrisomatales bacterium]|nr:DUF2232 domain-containing protein [Deferrisomatales bacterium]
MSQPTVPGPPPWLPAAGAGLLSGGLFVSSLWLPPFGFLGALVSPLPLARTALGQGLRGAGVAVGCGGAVLYVLAGPVATAVYASQFAAGGCALGLALRARAKPEVVVGAYALLAIAAFWLSLGFLAVGSGLGPLDYLDQALGHAVEQAGAFLLQGDADAEAALAVQSWAEQTRRVLSLTFPGLYAVLAILTGWVNALLARRGAVEAGEGVWSGWRAPESWIWGLIGAGLLALFAGGPLGTLALNVFVVALGIYFLQGLAVIHHLFTARGLPRFLRVAAYILLFVQLPLMLVVAALGAFDLWFDFRARWSPRPPEAGLHT